MQKESNGTPSSVTTCSSPPAVRKKAGLPTWKTPAEGTTAEESLSPTAGVKRRLDMEDGEFTGLRTKIEMFRKLVNRFDDVIAELNVLQEEEPEIKEPEITEPEQEDVEKKN